jgi:hypothetical protein
MGQSTGEPVQQPPAVSVSDVEWAITSTPADPPSPEVSPKEADIETAMDEDTDGLTL